MKKNNTLKDMLKEYLAPAGIGALAGVITTLITVVPQAFDKTQEIIKQQKKLEQIEADVSAYSKVVRKLYPLLTPEQLTDLFEDKGKVLITVDTGDTNNDTAISAELRQSPEGAYFIWCRTGMNTGYSGASLGFWLTRAEALAWANAYATASDFRETFGDDAFKLVNKNIQIGMCE